MRLCCSTLPRSLLFDRRPCRLGYLCEPSGMQVKIWIHWFSRSAHVAMTFRWRFHCHVVFCNGSR